MPLAAGTLFGHYVVEQMLGEGGMGCVYAAKDQTLGRRVALKLLRDQAVADPKMRERFLREARAGAALSHPNATVVHEIGEHEGHAYIAMEYLHGKTLRAYVGADAPDVATRIGWLVDVARVLAVAHAAGLVHRDIKPDNVMVTRDGVVKVLDFGIARPMSAVVDPMAPTPLPDDEPPRAESITTEGLIVGTPVYMAPEQMLGNPIDGRADQFAWGVLAYELLSGRIPWQGSADSSGGARLVALIVSGQPAPGLDAPNVTDDVRAIVARALEKDREKRFATMREIVEALSPATARSRASGEAAKSAPVKRASRVVPLAIAIGLAGAATIAVYVARDGSPRALRAPAETSAESSSAASASTTASAATAASPAPTVTTLTDHVAPPTKIPEAASEFAAGMQAFRDNNWFSAVQHFEHVTKLDPTMAAGHLRLSIAMIPFNAEKKRAEFAKTLTLRTQLSERDERLMNALAPVLQQAKEDHASAIKNLEALTALYPLDVELYDMLGNLQLFEPASLAPSERAVLLDDKDGNAWQNKGAALLTLGKVAEAREAFARCAALNVNSADCVMLAAMADSADGRCEDFEKKSRIAADRAPSYAFTQLWAMVAMGRPEPAIRETLSKYVATLDAPDRALPAVVGDAQLALVAGDFDRARRLAHKEAEALAANPSYRTDYLWNYQLAMQAVGAALESGDLTAARAAARDFGARSDAWTQTESVSHGVDLSLYLARVALPETRPAGFEDAPRMWADARLASGAYPGTVWEFAYAATAFTPTEARAALAALPRFLPLTPVLVQGSAIVVIDTGIPDADVGRAYLLADKPDEALPYLRRAVANCGVFNSPFAHTRATLDLGIAFEKTDKDGACGAYQKVIAGWGAAKPRSVTADEARKRAAALGCASKAP